MWARTKTILPTLLLALAGLGVSIVIARIHSRLANDPNALGVSFCDVNSIVNCDVVLGSRYATLAGAAISTWAGLFYLAILGLVGGVVMAGRAGLRESLARTTLLAAVWGVLFSAYMAFVALAVLRAICLMCSALYVINVGLFAAAWQLRSAMRVRGRRETADAAGTDRLVLLGSAAAVLLLIGIGAWEAFAPSVRPMDAAEVERANPDFYKSYLNLPVVPIALDEGHVRGSAAAPVTIVEFSDFECGHCAAFHEALDDVLPRLGQNVRVIFRHFPLDASCNPKVTTQLHPDACLAAVAAECAGKQGKFWQYHNLLFDHQQQLGRQFLISYATRLQLDVERFTTCLGSAEARAQVERDTNEGAALGIDSTPTVFINGRVIKGALDAQQLSNAIAIERAKRPPSAADLQHP